MYKIQLCGLECIIHICTKCSITMLFWFQPVRACMLLGLRHILEHESNVTRLTERSRREVVSMRNICNLNSLISHSRCYICWCINLWWLVLVILTAGCLINHLPWETISPHPWYTFIIGWHQPLHDQERFLIRYSAVLDCKAIETAECHWLVLGGCKGCWP